MNRIHRKCVIDVTAEGVADSLRYASSDDSHDIVAYLGSVPAIENASAIALNPPAVTEESPKAAPGTPAYIQCRMNLDNQRAQVAASDRSIALQYLLNHR